MSSPSKKPEPELVRPFYWTVGAYQLMIAHRLSSIWVHSTNGSYLTRAEVGTPAERAIAEEAIRILNDDWELREVRHVDEEIMRAAVIKAKLSLEPTSTQAAA